MSTSWEKLGGSAIFTPPGSYQIEYHPADECKTHRRAPGCTRGARVLHHLRRAIAPVGAGEDRALRSLWPREATLAIPLARAPGRGGRAELRRLGVGARGRYSPERDPLRQIAGTL